MNSSSVSRAVTESISSSNVEIHTYVHQLEKRLKEQEQLIALLNEKVARLLADADSKGDTVQGNLSRKPETRELSFVGSRESTVTSTPCAQYSQYFVSRVDPSVTAEVMAEDLLNNVHSLQSVKCSKMKTKYESNASFHVTVPSEQSKLVESTEAWPAGSFVKMFSGRLLPNYVLEVFDSNRKGTKGSTQYNEDTVINKERARVSLSSSTTANVSVGGSSKRPGTGKKMTVPLKVSTRSTNLGPSPKNLRSTRGVVNT